MNPQTLLKEVETWSPKAQADFAEKVSRLTSTERRLWYCRRGRTCDGRPHPGADYPHARGDQWPPIGDDWLTWFLRGGRGSGKTRTASEYVRYGTRWVPHIACIGLDVKKIRQTMVEGRSGLIRICEQAGIDYTWEPSKREFTFETGPGSGAKAFMYSAEEPDSLRSPEHGLAWADEPSHYPLIADVWHNLKFGLRVPGMPGGAKIIATSTPLPNKWTKALSADPLTRVSVVSTYANLDNLDPAFKATVLDEYEGTRLGRQELYGEILTDVEGALWHTDMITYVPEAERDDVIASLITSVVAVDPAGSVDRQRDETGIIVLGVDDQQNLVVLEDLSGHYSPNGWATVAVRAAERWGARAIVAERNYGGQMVAHTIHTVDEDITVRSVLSRRGKQVRAEPIVGRYEKRRVRHLVPLLELEEQMTTWIPAQGPSPDRVDALVHGATDLGFGSRIAGVATPAAYTVSLLGGTAG